MSSQHTLFGEELRRLRMASGLSLAELARRAHYSKGYLSKIESGTRPVSPQVARRCDAALGADGALARLVPPAQTARRPEPNEQEDDDRDVWIMSLGPGGGGWFTPVGRRDLLAVGGSALVGLGASPSALRVASTEEAGVDAYTEVFGQLRALGQVTAPALVLPVVIAQANALRSVAAAGGGPLHARWSLLAARHAEYAGWLAQESGDPRGARWWTDTAVRLTASGAPGIPDVPAMTDMAAHALVRRALIALYAEDGAATVELARRARRDPSAGARVRGLAALREAQGHALAGDPSACERALESGDLLLRDAPPADGSLALGSTNVDTVAVTRGWCLHDLGRPESAVDVLEPQFSRIRSDAHRSRARYGTRLALAHATAGELERACEITESVLGAVVGVDSATIRADLAKLARALTRWRTEPRVRTLQPRLTGALRTPTT
ncbi:XRE family transcriptional regulator [Actinomadura sp. KC216]|uniref:helix-turn-helix domain-containing protein n=1 Tax=Actinomadura sp. KC216 TaxID=2530370 RepID=UPI001047BFEF|nr:helix-turn-helix transcriptional regulator [Actinomadura sp. KC216]TDB83275.1 XRE family transcriptional regulator [Actinomadura sp. KC216]